MIVEVFIASGCQLCPAAVRAAEEAVQTHAADLVITDIDGDVELERTYRASIPVVVVGGREVGRYAVTAGEIIRALQHGS